MKQSFSTRIQLNEDQKKAMEHIIQEDSWTVLTGKPGTGKTHAGVYAAFRLLKEKQVKQVVLTRPTVEAGDRPLGYLKGDLNQKVDPYLLGFKELFVLFGDSPTTFDDMVKQQTIRVVPLQFMRSLTFGAGTLVYADEMQNSNETEMFLLLTRMGTGGRLIVTGDLRQKDTKAREHSGLLKLQEIKDETPYIQHFEFTKNERSERINHLIDVWENHTINATATKS